MTESKICTCPSGDGSLRWPCPAHPADQAGGDERAAFELFVRKHCGMPAHIAVNWDAKFTNDAWEGWKARAALAQPSPAPAEAERPEVEEVSEFEREDIASSAFETAMADGISLDSFLSLSNTLAARYDRIVGELRAEIAEWQEAAGRSRSDVVAYIAERAKLLEERDAALVEVERLRESKGDPVGSFEKCMKVMYERDEHAKRLEAALARVAELEKELAMARDAASKGDAARHAAGGMEMEIQELREKVTELQKKLRSRWTYASTQATNCAGCGEHKHTPLRVDWMGGYVCLTCIDKKLEELHDAQTQHSVPEEFSFEYRHPNGESHTVTVSRDQVINEMPDFLFEALCSKFCNCEPVGETNVVECCCDEYAEEFKLLAAAPGKEGV
ncbi:TPA: hypothetical protein ACGSS8_003094 [Pseudomonas aeruginosa]|nr:hypothetical protein [Pseudomonas aeruginosa]